MAWATKRLIIAFDEVEDRICKEKVSKYAFCLLR